MKFISLPILMICTLVVTSFEVRLPASHSIFSHDNKVLDTIVPFTGYWLSEDYFNCLNKFQSPRKANEINGCNFIVIPEKTNEPVIMICDFHEETHYSKISLSNDGFEITWFEQGGKLQKQIEIQVISKTQIQISDKIFIRINPSISHGYLHSSIEKQYLILEEILFQGKYQTIDKKNVEFKNNGEVLGLEEFKYYSPIIYYYNDEGLQVDQVYLGKSEHDNNMESYGFRFNNDTLALYKLNCIAFDSTSKNCAEVEFGKLIYKLIKTF